MSSIFRQPLEVVVQLDARTSRPFLPLGGREEVNAGAFRSSSSMPNTAAPHPVTLEQAQTCCPWRLTPITVGLMPTNLALQEIAVAYFDASGATWFKSARSASARVVALLEPRWLPPPLHCPPNSMSLTCVSRFASRSRLARGYDRQFPQHVDEIFVHVFLMGRIQCPIA